MFDLGGVSEDAAVANKLLEIVRFDGAEDHVKEITIDLLIRECPIIWDVLVDFWMLQSCLPMVLHCQLRPLRDLYVLDVRLHIVQLLLGAEFLEEQKRCARIPGQIPVL